LSEGCVSQYDFLGDFLPHEEVSDRNFLPVLENRMRRHFQRTGLRAFAARPHAISGENTFPLCPICNKAVPLETANTDEHGRAMHEECYLLKVRLEDATTLSLIRKPM
jgi:hypothetical protein